MWIIYSAIPPLLLVVYRFLGRGTFLSWLCWLSFLVSSACGFLAILLLWNVYPAEVRLTGCLCILRTYVYHSAMALSKDKVWWLHPRQCSGVGHCLHPGQPNLTHVCHWTHVMRSQQSNSKQSGHVH